MFGEKYTESPAQSGHFDASASTSSVATYASTIASEEDEEGPEFDVPEYTRDSFDVDGPYPASPPEFAELFPSQRRLRIAHDDTTLDGNMNLRVDTSVDGSYGRAIDLTLFHMRMYDLKSRDFSFRRYCRESGREVMHSSRPQPQPAVVAASNKRPTLQRSVSNALQSFRSSKDANLKRQDSGYSSSDDLSFEKSEKTEKKPTQAKQDKKFRLEFSNYAHVDLKRQGSQKNGKHYDFDYWGTSYSWKRTTKAIDGAERVFFDLINNTTLKAVAHIAPESQSPKEARLEKEKGGWIAPCYFWIEDQSVIDGMSDTAE
jgi:hypothetical protein